jgi:hypothetical protein
MDAAGKRPARSSAVRDLYQALWRADNHEDMLGMANVSIIFGLLVIPYLFAYLFQFKNLTMAGRIGFALFSCLLPSVISSRPAT